MWLFSVAWADPGSAWVIQDRTSREEGVIIQIGGIEVDASLPVELQGDVSLAVGVDGVLHQGWVGPGFVYVVSGARGKVRAMQPGTGVADDVVRLHADEQLARSLAADAEVELRLDADGWLLVGPDVLEVLSRVAVPEGDFDVELVPAGSVVGGFAAPDAETSPPTRKAARGSSVKLAREARRVMRSGVRAPLFLDREPGTVVRRSSTGETRPPGVPRPESAGWYYVPGGHLVLGVNGWAHRCTEEGCVDAGAWTSDEAGFRVGADHWVWQGGALVHQPAGAR